MMLDMLKFAEGRVVTKHVLQRKKDALIFYDQKVRNVIVEAFSCNPVKVTTCLIVDTLNPIPNVMNDAT